MTREPRTIAELADDYVLGLIDESELDAVEARLESDAEFARAVAASRDRFLELDMTAKPEVPSDALWSRIAERIDTAVKDTSPVETAPKVAVSDAANQNHRWWRGMAIATTAASILLGGMLVRAVVMSPDPVVIAVLVNQSGLPLAIVEDYGNASAKVTSLTEFDVPSDKTMQVWTLPSKERGPVSLGLLASSQSEVLDGPVLPRPQEGQLYEITLEPRDGSPTGRPTGAILVKGFARLVH